MPRIEELEDVIDDCLHLLMTAASFRHLSESFDGNVGSVLDLHMRLIQLRSIENDLVIRVCRLDDDHKSQTSFRRARTALQSEKASLDFGSIDKRLSKFRAEINPLKIQRRNRHVGHLSKDLRQPHDAEGLTSPTTVLGWCREPILIADQLAGETLSYGLRQGQAQGRLDLRAYCGIDDQKFPPIDLCINA